MIWWFWVVIVGGSTVVPLPSIVNAISLGILVNPSIAIIVLHIHQVLIYSPISIVIQAISLIQRYLCSPLNQCPLPSCQS